MTTSIDYLEQHLYIEEDLNNLEVLFESMQRIYSHYLHRERQACAYGNLGWCYQVMIKHPQAIFCQTKVWSPCPFGVQAMCFGKMHTEYLWSVHLFIVCQMFESNCEYHNVSEFGPVETGGRQAAETSTLCHLANCLRATGRLQESIQYYTLV